VASIGGETDLGGGAPKLNPAEALEDGSGVPSAGFATPNPNPTGFPILPPTFPKVKPLPLGGEPPPNVPKALVGLSVVVMGLNALLVGVKEEPPNRPVVFPVLDSSFPASLFVETLLNRSEDPGVKREGLLESVLVLNNDVVAPNVEVGFEDDSENADDVKKLGMDELEPKAGDEDVAESSLPLVVAGAGGVAKENEVDFDAPGSSDLVPNENVDFGASEVRSAVVGADSSLGLALGLKVGTETMLDDDVGNEKVLWGAELFSVFVLLLLDGVEPNPANPEKPFGAGNPLAGGAAFSDAERALELEPEADGF